VDARYPRAEKIARRIESGQVFINGWSRPTHACHSRREALGYGRELSAFGIH